MRHTPIVAMHRGRGFTLLELLVAVAIFAIVAVAAYSGLSALLGANARLDDHSRALNQLQLSLQIMERDLLQASLRTARDQYGDPQLPFVAAPGQDQLFSFTRSGWPNPAGAPRSDLVRVAYALDGDQLVRITWPQVDPGPGAEPSSTTLLDGVRSVDLRFLDVHGNWSDQWPPLGAQPDVATRPPRAVEVVIDTLRWGRLRRLFGLLG